IAMMGFVLSSMLGMGLGLRVGEIVAPLRNLRLVLAALVANFVILPAVAIGLGKVLGLDEAFAIGLLLLAAAAGAPFIPKLAQLARGNLAFSVGVMVLLMVVTVAYLPLALPLLLPGVTVDPWKIARSLLLLMFLPLAVGLAGKAGIPDIARKWKPYLDKLSSLSLTLLMVAITGANLRNVLSVFGTGGILAGLLLIALGFVAGWLLGGPDRDTRSVLALGTAQRNIAAALVVASGFKDPKVVVMVVVVAIVGLFVLMPFARYLAKGVAVPAQERAA
ncbi:MAG TPA: bile acid:sodium symporter, partial [Gemmatimonadales bacterium]|nr:bile acid:sodium symporter [Gemmatimonadales bacterium]